MHKFVIVALILCLGPVAALAEGVVRPLPRPAELAVKDAPLQRPLRRVGAVTPDLRALVEAALPPLPEPAALVLPQLAPGPLAESEKLPLDRPPRDRLVEALPPVPTEVILSTSNAPRFPQAADAVLTFVAAEAPPLGPRVRSGEAQVVPAAAVLPPLRPARRPEATLRPATVPVTSARPRARPDLAQPENVPKKAPEEVLVATVVAASALPASLRPAKRPKALAKRRVPDAEPEVLVEAAAVRVRPGESLVRPKKGSVCGDPSIRGEKLAPIPAKVKGCGITEPVRVTEVDGVRLSTPATLDCDAARALKKWIERGLKPAATGAKVKGLVVAASYSCRPRNNVRGAKVSEHGRGNAIDIAGVVLADGRTLDVLRDYKGRNGAILRRAHKAACGIFGTTLGPGSDGYHENHLHFDVAAYRSGPYCR